MIDVVMSYYEFTSGNAVDTFVAAIAKWGINVCTCVWLAVQGIGGDAKNK